MKSNIIDNFLNSITPEEEERWKQERIEYKNKLTSDFQLGFYVGEYIVDNYLPTLSTDSVRSRNVIEVSQEDEIENKRLLEEWFGTTRFNGGEEENGNKEKWNLYRQHSIMLEKKYLPSELICNFGVLNIQNMDEFKKGLQSSLWDCDICSYNIEPEHIKIYDDEDVRFTTIEFKLGDNEL